jgi:hypothetical protein
MMPLATKLALDLNGSAGPPTEVSPAVSMENHNACQVAVTVFRLTASEGLAIQLQESNDRENWTDIGGTTTIQTEGFTSITKVTGIATAYVRVKYSVADSISGIAILAAAINLATL